MYDYCSVCLDPCGEFKKVESYKVCLSCLYKKVWEELSPEMRRKFRDELWSVQEEE